jgi:hypothetical protein
MLFLNGYTASIRTCRLVATFCCLLGMPAAVSAQGWVLTFTASTDHSATGGTPSVNLLDSYALVVTPATGTALAPFSLGKPTPAGTVITVNIDSYITGLPQSAYTFVVRAIGPGGFTASAPGTFTTVPTPVIPPPPAAPSGVPGMKKGAPEPLEPIVLAWDPNPETDLARYLVGWREAPGTSEVAIPVGLVTTFTFLPPESGIFVFRVYAENTSGLRSGPSNEVSASRF